MPALLQHWPEIAGKMYADKAIPLQFQQDIHTKMGILTIKASGPVALEISHMEPQILERIALHLGYKAIHRLKIIQ